MAVKKCPRCKKEKELNEFYKMYGNSPSTYCKECEKEYKNRRKKLKKEYEIKFI